MSELPPSDSDAVVHQFDDPSVSAAGSGDGEDDTRDESPFDQADAFVEPAASDSSFHSDDSDFEQPRVKKRFKPAANAVRGTKSLARGRPGRGRASAPSSAADATAPDGDNSGKRGRGRPRKYPLSADVEAGPGGALRATRGRGRPPKNPPRVTRPILVQDPDDPSTALARAAASGGEASDTSPGLDATMSPALSQTDANPPASGIALRLAHVTGTSKAARPHPIQAPALIAAVPDVDDDGMPPPARLMPILPLVPPTPPAARSAPPVVRPVVRPRVSPKLTKAPQRAASDATPTPTAAAAPAPPASATASVAPVTAAQLLALRDWEPKPAGDSLPHLGFASFHEVLLPASAESIAELKVGSPSWPPACTVEEGDVIFNAGGPVWAADVCPVHTAGNGLVTTLLIACSAHRQDEPLHRPSAGTSTSLNVIQFWEVDVLTPIALRSTQSGRSAHTAGRFVMMAAHHTGYVSALRWNPCVLPDDAAVGAAARVGLLAALHGDGVVRVYAVPLPSQELQEHLHHCELIVNMVPVATCALAGNRITCMDWHPRDSRLLLTGGVDGSAHIWNLESEVTSYSGVRLSHSHESAGFPVMCMLPHLKVVPLGQYCNRGYVGHRAPVTGVAWLGDAPVSAGSTALLASKRFAVIYEKDSVLRVWSAVSTAPDDMVLLSRYKYPRALSALPNGEGVLVASEEGGVVRVDIPRDLLKFKISTAPFYKSQFVVWDVCALPTGRTSAAASVAAGDGCAKLFVSTSHGFKRLQDVGLAVLPPKNLQTAPWSYNPHLACNVCRARLLPRAAIELEQEPGPARVRFVGVVAGGGDGIVRIVVLRVKPA